VTHDPREAAGLCDCFVVLENGRVVQEGQIQSLRANPATPFVERMLEDLGSISTKSVAKPG
jgi:molybdate transport system ATP-binding protein